MRLFSKYRLGLAVVGSVGILFSLERCSPIAPSIYRNSFSSKPDISQPISSSDATRPQASSVVTVVANSNSKPPRDPEEPRAVKLDAAQVAELRANGHSTWINVPAVGSQGYILFETSLSDDELKSVSGFQAKLIYQSGSSWNLLIPSSVDSSARDSVLDPANLVRVTVTLGR